MTTKTLKNFEIINILNALFGDNSLLTSKDTKLPVAILWKINGNVKALQAIQERIAEEERKINDEYFNNEKATEVNGQLTIKQEYVNEFVGKKDELMNIENEVSLSMISIDSISDINLAPADFMAIEFMIEGENA